MGHEFAFFSSHREELVRVGDYAPQVIFCAGVPMHQTGFEMGQALKSHKLTGGAGLVVCTTLGDENLYKEWDSSSIDAVLVKPFTRESVERVLAQLERRYSRPERSRRLAVVVDDNKTARTVLEKQMHTLGFDVQTAVNGQAGYELILRTKPDILLTDVEMPVMNGYELCVKLAENPETQRLPILVVSSTVTEADVRQGFKSGVLDFLRKPFDSFKLSEAVATAMGRENVQRDGIAVVLSSDMKFTALLGKLFADLGLQDHQCANLNELSGYLSMIVPDIIAVDFSSVDQQACNMLEKLREPEELKASPILVMVEADDRGAMIDCLQRGANDFLIKPFLREEFNARVLNLVRTKSLFDELKQSSRILEGLAFIDSLTGLLNRRYLEEGLQQQFIRAERMQRPLSIMMIDLDHFKRVNDMYGHAIGDEVLKSVSETVKSSVRNIDIACRYGGEELCVLMPGTPPRQARDIAEQVRRNIETKTLTPKLIRQTVSLGVSTFPDLSGRDTLLSDADKALYLAKNMGRNRVLVKDEDIA
ncbi:MAG TPA: diguanylate cyclase [bacterium]|nr:diguanylate cyclase [bacterium]